MDTTAQQAEQKANLEWLRKFGMKWAVLAALVSDLRKRGIRVPPEVNEQIKLARMQIMSGCFAVCEVGCTLGKLEGQLVAIGSSAGEDYLRPWSDLLGRAMEGRLDPGRVSDIPALEPVVNECKLLACRCGETSNITQTLRPEEGSERS